MPACRRGVAQSGSASGLGPEGPGFKSRRPDYMSQVVSAFGENAAPSLSTEHFGAVTTLEKWSIIQTCTTIALAIITAVYVYLTRKIARAATEQIVLHRRDQQRELWAVSKRLVSSIGQLPFAQRPTLDDEFRHCILWTPELEDRFLVLSSLLGSEYGDKGALGAYIMTGLRERILIVREALEKDGTFNYDKDRFWETWMDHRKVAHEAVQDVMEAVGKVPGVWRDHEG